MARDEERGHYGSRSAAGSISRGGEGKGEARAGEVVFLGKMKEPRGQWRRRRRGRWGKEQTGKGEMGAGEGACRAHGSKEEGALMGKMKDVGDEEGGEDVGGKLSHRG